MSYYSIKINAVTIVFLIILSVTGWAAQGYAQTPDDKPYDPKDAICGIDNRGCMLNQLRGYAKTIDQQAWRDKTFRELAKSYAADGLIDTAISIIPDITTPDTKAMTIRGIGMEMAGLGFTQEQLDQEFAKLHQEATKIEHPPSHAIALTYIAMAQAFAGDNEGAWKTAAAMDNEALRHKAYAETSEVQAEHGNYEAAIKSIGFIESEPFRNKAYVTISKIFADRGLLEESYQSAMKVTNAYNKTQAMQYMLDRQKAYSRGEKPKDAEDYDESDGTP